MGKPFIFTVDCDSRVSNMVEACARLLQADVLSEDSLYLDEPELMNDPDAYRNRILEAIALVGFVNETTGPITIHTLGIVSGAGLPLIVLAHSNSLPQFYYVSGQPFIFQDAEDPATQTRLLESLRQEIRRVREGAKREKTDARRRVFISYSHRDVEYLKRLAVHLRPLERTGSIDAWADTRIQPGQDWKQSIDDALQSSRVAILLISADFLSSDFIANDELPPILQRAEEHGTLILPVVIKPCRFLRELSLRKFQCVNDPNRPVGLLSEVEQEAVYDKVAQEVERWLARG